MRSSKPRGGAATARALSVEGIRLLTWWPLWLLVVLLLGALVITYQSPRSYDIKVGAPSDQAYVTNFHARLDDSGRLYRWSDIYGYIAFPGLGGSRPFTVQISLDPARTAPVTLIVNGETLFQKTLQPGWQTINLRVDSIHPSALASRDTVLEIRAPDYRTEDSPTEPKGVKVSDVVLAQDKAGGFISPPLARVAQLAVATILLYLFAGLALLGWAKLPRARLWALILAFVFALTLIGFEWADRVALSAAALHLCITLASAIVLIFLVYSFGVERGLRPGTARMLGVLVGVAFALRYGGMALPQAVIIDMPWHMKWLRTLLSGDWQSLYFPGGLSSVPAEWGLNVLIPKSPLFYFAAAPLGVLPFDLETLVKLLVCFMDASLVIAVFWLARRVGASSKAALISAGLYAFMPLAFRAFSYGILPTIFAQWLATLTFVWFLNMWGRRMGIAELAGFTLLLCLTLLAFPTVAVFVSMVLFVSALVWGFLLRGSWQGRRSFGAGSIMALAAAWGLAIIAYYGLYISPVITSAAALLTPKTNGGTTVRWPGGFPDLLAWTADYVVSVLPALLAAVGVALFFVLRSTDGQRSARWFLLAWAVIAPLFLLVNYRVDMIGKHLFFTMVPFAVAGGAALLAVARRGRGWGPTLASLAFAAVAYQGIIFWIDRLLRASS